MARGLQRPCQAHCPPWQFFVCAPYLCCPTEEVSCPRPLISFAFRTCAGTSSFSDHSTSSPAAPASIGCSLSRSQSSVEGQPDSSETGKKPACRSWCLDCRRG